MAELGLLLLLGPDDADTRSGWDQLGPICGYMAKAHQREFALEAAVTKANKAAARTVAKSGAQNSIPWHDDL